MGTEQTAIRVSRVAHEFGDPGDARSVRALAETSIDVVRGELLALIGPSGCGKTTLLNIIGGLLAPSGGTVDVGGTRVHGPQPRSIAYVFQENALFPWSTVEENVGLGMTFQDVVPAAERPARARKALQDVGLADFAQH